jgi:hypothetical protein
MRYFFLGIIFFTVACGSMQVKVKDVVIEPPVSESTPVVDDSSFLSVTVLDSAIDLKVLDKAATVKDAAGVNDFITANKALIDEDKITLHAGSNIPFEKYKPVIEVMSKNGYSKFRMAKN